MRFMIIPGPATSDAQAQDAPFDEKVLSRT